MKLSEIFERAAELVHTRKAEFSCHAVDDACDSYFSDARIWYVENVLCGCDDPDILWDARNNFYSAESARHPRVIALCLAAAIARSEGL